MARRALSVARWYPAEWWYEGRPGMRVVTYVNEAGEARSGVVSGERIIDLAQGAAAIGKDLPADLVGLLTLEEAGLAIASEVLAQAANADLPGVPLDGAQLK